ncbi:hypothetical protein KFU94_24580 [Chloroflexi bacterium TSY]|nr:hypothetical protein [Chloroflexi bacterium TSY]
MNRQLTLTMSDEVLEQLSQLAAERSQALEEFAAEILNQIVANRGQKGVVQQLDTRDDAIDDSLGEFDFDEETLAYIRLHPQLKKEYFGQYVAIYSGKLIDYDEDFDELYDRIDTKYPDEFVYMTQVRDKPIRTIRVPSFRIVQR